MSEQVNTKVESVEDLPVSSRRKTDFFCTIVNTVFVVLLFIIFLFTLNVVNLRKITYPNDSEGRLCGYDNSDFPYLYFTSPADTSKRLCVSKCPTNGDTSLSCLPTASLSCLKNSNPKYNVQIYDSYLEQSRIGLICLPTDAGLKDTILTNSDTKSKYQFLGFYDAIWRSIWIGVIFGIAYSLFIYFQPYIAIPWTIFVGGILSVIFGILILILADGYFLVKLLLFLFFVVLGLYSFITFFDANRRESICICARLMHAAAVIEEDKDHEALPQFILGGLKQFLKPFLVILCFMALFGVFLILIAFQVLSAWSCSTLKFNPTYPFYEVQGFGSSFLMFLILIEFIWGMSFLKQAFNFIVSGYSAHKYFSIGNNEEGDDLRQRKPSYFLMFQLLLRYHWGTVAGGSLLLGFFYFVDLLFDFILPQQIKVWHEDKRKPIGYEREVDNTEGVVGNTQGFFNLIREESFAYTFLTNLPYCNSSRYCEYLSVESKFYNYSQTTNRLFRLNAHIIPIFFTLMIAMLSMQSSGNSSPYGIICISMITFFTITYFLAYQGDTAEGLLISTYVELGLTDEDQLSLAPKIIKKAYEADKSNLYKNKQWHYALFNLSQDE